MKNIFNFFLTICVAVFFSAHVNAKTKVSLWSESASDPAFSALNKIVADFNASQDEIEVEHTAYENTPYETTLKTAFSGGTPADIVTINGGSNMYQYAEVGGLVDITDFVNSISDRIAPGVESVYTFDGKLWGVPQGLHIGNLIWYRKDMFEEMGIDPKEMETWSGFTGVAQKLQNTGVAQNFRVQFRNELVFEESDTHYAIYTQYIGHSANVKSSGVYILQDAIQVPLIDLTIVII